MDSYDAGLLNDFGGGDVEWWQDYIRAELNRAEDFYRDQFDRLTAQLDASQALLAERDEQLAYLKTDTDFLIAERDAEIARFQQQSVDWVAVFDENAALRAEVERLREQAAFAQKELADVIHTRNDSHECIRKQAAQECYNLVNTFAMPDIEFVLAAIKSKFGLEG